MKLMLGVISGITILMFAACSGGSEKQKGQKQDVSLTQEDTSYYLNLGDQITKSAFDTLSKTLQSTIAERGVVEAIEFCKINALPLTSSVAGDDDIIIRRAAIKYRNPLNEPDDIEKEIFSGYLGNLEKGEDLPVSLVVKEDTIHYFKAIKLMPMCTMCHGDKAQISAEVLSKLNEEYPDDLATGFEPGDLRGMWHIKFHGKK